METVKFTVYLNAHILHSCILNSIHLVMLLYVSFEYTLRFILDTFILFQLHWSQVLWHRTRRPFCWYIWFLRNLRVLFPHHNISDRYVSNRGKLGFAFYFHIIFNCNVLKWSWKSNFVLTLYYVWWYLKLHYFLNNLI